MKIKITLTYEYEGDAETDEQAVKEEQEALINGDVSIADILETGHAIFTVETVEEPVD